MSPLSNGRKSPGGFQAIIMQRGWVWVCVCNVMYAKFVLAHVYFLLIDGWLCVPHCAGEDVGADVFLSTPVRREMCMKGRPDCRSTHTHPVFHILANLNVKCNCTGLTSGSSNKDIIMIMIIIILPFE